MDVEMANMAQAFSLLSVLYQSAEKTMQLFYEYRFLLRDIYLIFRENDTVRGHYIQLQNTRKEQFNQLFESMINQGVLRGAEFPNEYERLYERISILGDHWINASDLFMADQENPTAYFQDLLFEMIYPYLTEKGKAQYAALHS